MAAVADALVSKLASSAATLAEEEMNIISTAKEELHSLLGKLNEIKSTVRKAESLQFFKQKEIKQWIRKLKDAVCNAEDIIEEYQVKIHLQKEARPGCWHALMNQVSEAFACLLNCFNEQVSYRLELGHNLKKVNQEFNQIGGEAEENILHAIEKILQQCSHHTADGSAVSSRATTSSLIKGEEIGREKDKKELISKLTEGDVSKKRNFSVISIVGQGGLGKTYLAKMIFNDEQVKKHFSACAWWIYISENLNPQLLVTKMLETILGKAPDGVTQMETLCNRLGEEISGKKYLMVLDDVWNLDWWEKLEASLQLGASGSKFLITTRSRDLLKRVDPVHLHELRQFSFEESWLLFSSKALKDNETEDLLKEKDVKDIGVRIVNKCGGLPLVIQSVGSLMRTKILDKREWKAVERSNIWTWDSSSLSSSFSSSPQDGNLLPGLILSYDDLRPHLKNCFVYCTVFPKNYNMPKEELIHQWIAHGLVEEEEGVDIEQTANNYLDELVSRCLLEKLSKNKNVFLMQGIIHDLALFIADEEYSHDSIGEHTSHLSLIGKDSGSLERAGLKATSTKLRTLLCPIRLQKFPLAEVVNNLKGLRVLQLSRSCIEDLPDCLGDLPHLRYLDLKNSDIKQLPASIGKLYNLQSLNLSYSKIEALPKEIGDLCNLRYLKLRNTRLSFMPKSLGNLTNLHTLDRFIISSNRANESGCSIKELKGLNKLKGELSIGSLERMEDGADAQEALLDQKYELTQLSLTFNEDISPDTTLEEKQVIAEKHKNVLGGLQPPHGLQAFHLRGYMGETIQHCDWPKAAAKYRSLRTVYFSNCEALRAVVQMPTLSKLSVIDCKSLHALPSMPALEKLNLRGCHELVEIPCLPSIEKMTLVNLHIWEGWPRKLELLDGVMLRLKILVIQNCPQIRLLPYFPALEKLITEGLTNWEGWSRVDEVAMPCLKHVEICHCLKFKMLPQLPTLEILKMKNLTDWEGWSRLDEASMPCLKHLEIHHCPKSKMLPHLPTLETLKMDGLTNWEGWSTVDEEELSCLKYVKILDCPNLKMLPHLPALENLFVAHLANWEGWSGMDEATMSCLKHMEICHCPKFKILPQLPTLKVMKLIGLINWEGWSKTDEAILSCLIHVEISHCPKFKMLPHLPELQILKMEGLINWEGWQRVDAAAMPFLKHVQIHHCPSLSRFPPGFLDLWRSNA